LSRVTVEVHRCPGEHHLNTVMRIHELLDGHSLRWTDPGPGTSTPLATIAAPGAASVDQEFTLTGLKPLRRLKPLKRGGLSTSPNAWDYRFEQ
jgi:hypothetical protein